MSQRLPDRLRDASCLSVVSFNSIIRAWAQSSSYFDFRFTAACIFSVLLSSAYSLMRGSLCAIDVHRNCDTLPVLHRRLSIVDRTSSSDHRSIASHSSRIAICAYPICTRRPVPAEIVPSRLVWKTRMVWLPDVEKILKIRLFVSAESTKARTWQTDGHWMMA